MKIKFLGASSGIVTGSSYVLTSGAGSNLLIDLGMFQGVSSIEKHNYEPFDYDCSQLTGAILTHAHLDHCGRLPIIMPKGFTGEVWMTAATRDLTELSLFDTAKIAKQDQKPILFDSELVEKTLERCRTTDYHTPVRIGDFTITFKNAGHILGSASLEIVDNSPNSVFRKIIFSGDLGNTPEPLQQETETFADADAVVMESTYGDRLHPAGDSAAILLSQIQAIETSGGALLIPAFSLERTQELLHLIMHLKKNDQISAQLPVYLDSPMGEKATTIYTHYPQDLNTHLQDEIQAGRAFDFPGLRVIERRNESEQVHAQPGPKVIIAGSGMMTGGRILGHAAHYLPMSSTRLLIVGYQGEGTIGRELQEGKKRIFIDGNAVQVQATVQEMRTMSSHADQSQLISWLKNIHGVKKLFLTHGEDGPRHALAQKIIEDVDISDITLPTLSQQVEL